MNNLTTALTCYFICYILEMSSLITYIKLTINDLTKMGIKVYPFTVFVLHGYFMLSFLSMLSIMILYFSKRQNMFIPFLIFDGNILFQSTLNLFAFSRNYTYLANLGFLCLGYLIIIYYNKPIYSHIFEYESRRAGITEKQRRGVKVSKN
ncbi:hypothetical protein TUBRATIS_17810 [Tubulinosema ratisbonensis]|uniref:Uncharacterized protein n=1 Tax=Tubulinosema ratisbonensis TaxID=291195 RepID=A0A437AKZ3_9MICR|nr:hypothetical protein TUBRATIS_17810 [Tubulinosema ratisbonensis]